MIWLALACKDPEPQQNRLATSTSPYLQQHASNPVDWYEWGPEAFEVARETGRPIFLSIGYASCHWCHVMAHESFEDPEVAAYMNAHFVNIKLDREERPDVDALYMQAVRELSGGQGGWPASIWLDTDLRPFHAGTYFPPEPAPGRPSFQQALTTVHEAWTQEPDRVQRVAATLTQRIQSAATLPAHPLPTHDVVAHALSTYDASWDPVEGGFGRWKKFPMSPRLAFLLDQGVLRDDPDALDKVRVQLHAMDRGGIHDHLGGGFHRYTVDGTWTVPHFEKMLYDNAQLLGLYAEASTALGEPRFAQVADDIATYLVRDMQSPHGGFYSSEDADSAGEEGTFYIWTAAQVDQVLGDHAGLFTTAYPMRENFEGQTVLRRGGPGEPESPQLKAARLMLYTARLDRVPPPTDTKRVVAWNGMAISGLATSGRLHGRPEHVAAAVRAAKDVLAHRRDDGSLPRTLDSDIPGTLSDHALMAQGLLDLYQADPDPTWLVAADELTRVALTRFTDAQGGVFEAPPEASELLARQQDAQDDSDPSGWGVLLATLTRLEAYGSTTPDATWMARSFDAAAIYLARAPEAAPTLVQAHDLRARPTVQVVLTAPSTDDPTLALFSQVYANAVRPDAVLGIVTPENTNGLRDFALFTGKIPGATTTAYVCVDRVCHLPTDELDVFTAQLEQLTDGR